MEENMSLVETDKIEEKIQMVLRQTDYTYELAREKLKDNNYDEIKTIRSYFGIQEKSKPEIKSINQCIYKALRQKLDSNMRDYKERTDNKGIIS
jgi:hypothetical protein